MMWFSSTAVSYTHLDVYKRQSENTSVAYTSTKLLKEQLDSVRSMILVIGGLIGCIMAFAGPVSYTHLDVYKRQDPER